MAKKLFGDGAFFCWNCGKRIEKGKRKCPYCGAHYSGINKYKYPPPEILRPEITPHHRSFRAFRRREWLAFFVWTFGNSALLPLVIKLGGSDTGSLSWDYVFWVVRYVWALMWAFWIIWAVGRAIQFRKRRKKAWEQNRAGDGGLVCAACGSVCDRNDNFCDRCGCLLLK